MKAVYFIVGTDNLPEDVEMANCLRSLGVKFQDTRFDITVLHQFDFDCELAI